MALLGEWPTTSLRYLNDVEEQGWLVRIDAEGLTWRDGPRLSWPAVAEVKIPKAICPGWSRSVRVLSHAQVAWAARAGTRPRGLAIPTTSDVTTDDIAAAVRAWSDVPIRY